MLKKQITSHLYYVSPPPQPGWRLIVYSDQLSLSVICEAISQKPLLESNLILTQHVCLSYGSPHLKRIWSCSVDFLNFFVNFSILTSTMRRDILKAVTSINTACVSYGSPHLKRLWSSSVNFLIFLPSNLNKVFITSNKIPNMILYLIFNTNILQSSNERGECAVVNETTLRNLRFRADCQVYITIM